MSAPGLAQTGADIISSSMRLIRVMGSGEKLTQSDSRDGLVALNQMLDSWQLDRLMIFTVAIQDFSFQSTKQTYTMGSGGDFNVPRPAKIERASIVLLSNPTNPLELSLKYTQSEAEWQSVLLKTITTTFPQMVYDDGAFPLRSLNFWPVPRDANNFRCYSWSALNQFTDLITAYTFPPGYLEAIRYNLALRLAEEWGASIGPMTVALAKEALQRIRTFNVPLNKLKCDDAVCGSSAGSPNYRQELFNIP